MKGAVAITSLVATPRRQAAAETAAQAGAPEAVAVNRTKA